METIIKGNLMFFKTLEQKIYAYMCELACMMTRIMLESYDDELASLRDTRQYQYKRGRKTNIKTVYGEVEYYCRVYKTELFSH